MLQRLYEWMMDKAAHAHAERWLFLFSFIESSFFPIPPHPLLVPSPCPVLRRLSWTLSSLVGSTLSYQTLFAGSPRRAFIR